MHLQEVLDQFTHGELSQLAIGGNEVGVIDENNLPRVLPSIQLALTALYKRFNLKEGRVVLQTQPGQTLYHLHSRYAVMNEASEEPVQYLIDSAAEPFQDQLLKLERVIAVATGKDLPLNDAASEWSAVTPTLRSLRLPASVVAQANDVPEDFKSGAFELVFRANHPKLAVVPGETLLTEVELELPETHLEPLLYYVAARMLTPAGMSAQDPAPSLYMAKFEAACQELENKGFAIDQGGQNTRLAANGWV